MYSVQRKTVIFCSCEDWKTSSRTNKVVLGLFHIVPVVKKTCGNMGLFHITAFSYHCIQSVYCSYCRPLNLLTKTLNVAI
nr:MAG TPA: hypothetical protein [Caudoviricetes sp.]